VPLVLAYATMKQPWLAEDMAAKANRYAVGIQSSLEAVPSFVGSTSERWPYGARSEGAVFVGDLLCEEVPDLARPGGSLDLVAIARRPGVLSKVAVRARPDGPTPIVVGIGADQLARVSERLDGERIEVVAWQRSARAYIADALGLGQVPPMLLLPAIGHARVLLGEIDVRGIAGWRGINVVLASALTGWRIRLEAVANTPAWRRLHTAMQARRPVAATVVGRTERGLRVEVLGLFAMLSGSVGTPAEGQEVEVRITRMDPDEGRIFVSDRHVSSGQLPLI
jgi:N utilization substance protein A